MAVQSLSGLAKAGNHQVAEKDRPNKVSKVETHNSDLQIIIRISEADKQDQASSAIALQNWEHKPHGKQLDHEHL